MGQQRYAFLFGANGPQTKYLNRLHYAERDIERLSKVFKAKRFAFTDVQPFIAYDRESTLTKLQHAARQCEPTDLFIVHYSGHGLYRKRLYLICNNADIENLRATAIEIEAVKEILDECRARHKLLILDCCYAGGAASGLFKSDQDIQTDLSKTFEGSAGIIISACSRIDTTRELTTLDEGSGFLSWVFIAACTSRFGEVSPDARSLSLMDIWRWLPRALQEVNQLLAEYEQLPRPWLNQQLEAGTDGEIWLTKAKRKVVLVNRDPGATYDRDSLLQDLCTLHGRTINELVDSFVGRVQELDDLQQRISSMQHTGGYITITGGAGQGKSSIIAKLVEQAINKHGPDNVAYHFILFDPGPEYQVGLLRNLMACLVFKYNLTDLYIASENRAALRDYFPRVLEQVAAKGGKEVIFIDGLDQLEADANGIRDLSFLPVEPPEGIVFVLGTRPNDTLEPLELRKPNNRYLLPDLSRQDFALILQHHGVSLDSSTIDQLYKALQGNALYLDLAAKELADHESIAPDKLIKQLADDPDSIFSVAIQRLKRRPLEWREVLKPILGVLLVAHEPLGVRHIRDIINSNRSRDRLIEADRLSDGLQSLGGLIARDTRYHYTLFHKKFYYYLRQDESRPERASIFATDEEERWHERLAEWCEGDNLAIIWNDLPRDQVEQERRSYGRQHYITHLYQTRNWQRLSQVQEKHNLFAVLDIGDYGRAKVRFDPSTRSYAQDLDLGRQAASWQGWTFEEGISLLPRLWQYTLLRCSLASRADRYPEAAFKLLVLLGNKQQALNLAELLTVPAYKVHILLQIAEQLREQGGTSEEYDELLLRVEELITSIAEIWKQSDALSELAQVLAWAKRWKQAEQVIASIKGEWKRARASSELAQALVQAGHWEDAKRIIASIDDSWKRAEAWSEFAQALAQIQYWEEAEQAWIESERVISNVADNGKRNEALSKLAQALAQAERWEHAERVISSVEDNGKRKEALSKLAQALAQARRWKQTAQVIINIKDSGKQAEAFGELARTLTQAQHPKQAEQAWMEAERVITSIKDSREQAEAFSKLAWTLTQAQRWEQAEQVWREAERVITSIKDSGKQAEAFSKLAQALAQAERWEQAVRVIANIENSGKRNEALSKLAQALTQARRWKQTAQVIINIKDSGKQAKAFSELAQALIRAQHPEQAERTWTEAERVIASIEGSEKQAEAFSKLAWALIQAQCWEQAEQVIVSMENIWKRTKMLSELAQALEQVESLEQAERVWTEAEQMIANIESSWKRTEMLSELAQALIQAQRWEQAERVIVGFESSWKRTEMLSELAQALIQAQRWEQAERMIANIEGSWERTEMLSELSQPLMRLQSGEEAKQAWVESERVISSVVDSGRPTEALNKLAQALAQARRWKQAARVIISIEDRGKQAEAFSELARALTQAQHPEQAEQAWTEAERVIAGIEDRGKQAQAWSKLGQALAQAERWEQAERVIVSIEDRGKQAQAWSELARALTQAQHPEQAEQIWTKAEQVIVSIEGDWKRAEALSELAQAFVRAGYWKQAERVINNIRDSGKQVSALNELGQVLVRMQRWEQAEQVIISIRDNGKQVKALSELAQALIQAQHWEQGERVIAGIRDSEKRAEALYELAQKLAQARSWDLAEHIVTSIENDEKRFQAFESLAASMALSSEYKLLLNLIWRRWELSRTRDEAFSLFPIATGLVSFHPDLGIDLFNAFCWVDAFVKS
jgi:tetratricopeptide (TPR) repeat protein